MPASIISRTKRAETSIENIVSSKVVGTNPFPSLIDPYVIRSTVRIWSNAYCSVDEGRVAFWVSFEGIPPIEQLGVVGDAMDIRHYYSADTNSMTQSPNSPIYPLLWTETFYAGNFKAFSVPDDDWPKKTLWILGL